MPPRRTTGTPRALAALVAPVVLALPGAARGPQGGLDPQDAKPPPVVWDEGPLGSPAVLPEARESARLLALGDEALARARRAAAGPASSAAARDRALAFESWRAALAAAPEGSGVAPAARAAAPPALTGQPRLLVGCERALAGRLELLADGERRQWTEETEPLAAAALRSAGADEERLAACLRLHPATASAVGAALALADGELERGGSETARAWLERAAEELRRLGPGSAASDELARAAAARRAALGARAEDASARATAESFDAADGFTCQGALALLEPLPPRPAAGAGLAAGLAWLADDEVAIQGPERVEIVDLEPLAVRAAFRPATLLGRAVAVRAAAPETAVGAGGWPHAPLALTDGGLALVHGRLAREVFRFGAGTEVLSEVQPNALLAVDLERDPAGAPRRARLRWALCGSRLIGPDGRASELPELSPLAEAELQPGPVLAAGQLVACARNGAGGSTAWLVALDPASGAPAWLARLGSGAELAPGGLRMLDEESLPRGSAAPLAALGSQVLCSTQLGFAALVDALDGRLVWALATRRRDDDDPGGAGGAPDVHALAAGAEAYFAPADSDRGYLVEWSADPAEAGVGPRFTAFPVRAGEVPAAGVAAPGWPLAARAEGGAARLVDGRRDGARSESTAGRAGELAIAPPLAGARRAWLASSAGLALFDRERELALLEREPWPAVAVGAGTGSESGAPTSLHARGPRAVVLAPTLLYSFRTDRR